MFKKLLIIVTVATMLIASISLSSCSQTKNTEQNSTTEGTTEKPTEPLTTKQILKKAKKHLNKIMPLKKSTVYDSDDDTPDNQIQISPKDDSEKILDYNIYFDDDVELTVNTSTIRDLISYGFKKGNQKKAYKSDDISFTQDIYMLLNDKYLHVGVDRVSDQEKFGDLIRNVDLQTDEKAVDFNYYGFTKDSTMEDVLSSLGYPNNNCNITYYEDTEKCIIHLLYSDQYNSNEDSSIFANFNFLYDPYKDSSKLYEIFINT